MDGNVKEGRVAVTCGRGGGGTVAISTSLCGGGRWW